MNQQKKPTKTPYIILLATSPLIGIGTALATAIFKFFVWDMGYAASLDEEGFKNAITFTTRFAIAIGIITILVTIIISIINLHKISQSNKETTNDFYIKNT